MKTLRLSLALLLTVALVAACGRGKSGGGGDDDDDDDGATLPVLSSITPDQGLAGTEVTLAGQFFGAAQGTGAVSIGGEAASVSSWADTQIVATVPSGAFPGGRDVVVSTDAGDSNALVFTVVLPRAVYADADTNPNQVEAFSIAGATPTPLPDAPYPFTGFGNLYGGYAENVVLSRETRRLFSVSSQEIVSWDVDPLDGSLTRAGELSVPGTEHFGLAVSPDGTRLVAANFDGLATVMAVAADGSLTELTGSPSVVTAGASHVAITNDGAFAYVMDEGGGTGSLHARGIAGTSVVELPGTPYTVTGIVTDIEMAPNADRLYLVAANTDTVFAYDVQTDGSLVANMDVSATVNFATSLCFDGDGSRLFVVDFGVLLYVYDVNAGTGALTPVTGSPFTLAGVETSGIACSRDGSMVAIPDYNDPRYNLYAIDAAGVPTEVAGSPFSLVTTSGNTKGFAFSF